MHKTYYILSQEGEYVPILHIAEFARRLHLNQATVRDMLNRIEKGTVAGTRFRRPLKHIRDDSTVWVYQSEVTDYPIIKGTNCYHFNPQKDELELCVECTMGNGCKSVKAGEVPV